MYGGPGLMFLQERVGFANSMYKRLCGYKLFSCLTNSGPESSLTSRLRGSDDGERFVIPAEAGGKRPAGDSDPAFIMQ